MTASPSLLWFLLVLLLLVSFSLGLEVHTRLPAQRAIANGIQRFPAYVLIAAGVERLRYAEPLAGVILFGVAFMVNVWIPAIYKSRPVACWLLWLALLSQFIASILAIYDRVFRISDCGSFCDVSYAPLWGYLLIAIFGAVVLANVVGMRFAFHGRLRNPILMAGCYMQAAAAAGSLRWMFDPGINEPLVAMLMFAVFATSSVGLLLLAQSGDGTAGTSDLSGVA